jgi:alpha-glucosidase
MTKLKWWQTAVFYQIYPRSFADGNGDGIGDFRGMTAKLDYLKSLGVDALWLSPHFPSPMWDCGYDISDYEAVAPEYGTLDDFRVLLNEAHARSMRVILDLVLNHTSDEHPWFIESKSSRENKKADWYVWEDPAPLRLPPFPNSPVPAALARAEMGEVPRRSGEGGAEPNNWQSCFDGPAWTYAPERGQYYYHYFMKQQPDLNWNNPEVKAAMWKAVRFWLDMGVDGFRLDAIGTIFEHPDRPNHPVPMTLAELRHFGDTARTDEEKKLLAKYWYEMFMYQWGRPHDLMKELRAILKAYPGDRMLVGEDDDVSYHGTGDDELNMVFNFPLMRTDHITPDWVRKNQKERLAALEKISAESWACNTLGNHDCSRVYTRYGHGQHNAELARLNLALMLTLRGTPFLYNGEEIGMTDLMILDPSKLRDTMATWYYSALLSDPSIVSGQGLKLTPPEAARHAAGMTRDKNRTPMQWTGEPNGGFCPADVMPWLPVNPNHAEGVNVVEQENAPGSLLNFYRRMLQVRKETPALVEGDYRVIHPKAEEYLAFLRNNKKQSVLVVLNYSSDPLTLNFPALDCKSLRTILSSAGRGQSVERRSNLHIAPFEVYLSELTQ